MNQHKPRWTAVDDVVRRTMINQLRVERPPLEAVLERMNLMRQGHREGREATCMTLTGEPGVGKSEFLKLYELANPIVEERTDEAVLRRRPVIYVELLPASTVMTASNEIMKALLGPNAPAGTAVRDGLMERQLKVQRVEILILDEFQHVGEKGAEKTRAQTADFFKGLTKRTRIPIVMAGIPVVESLIEDNMQLDTITPYRFQIPPYGFVTEEEKRGFRSYLAEIDARLPFDQSSHLEKDDLSTKLFLASGGNLRTLMRMISEAGRLAIDEHACSIFERHLHEAYGVEALAFGNPFEPLIDEAA